MIYKDIFKNIVISLISNTRNNISKQKNRGEVSFSNKKPWKQKGTGNSRAGRRSSPIWRKGGRSFPNGKENYKKKINKKLYFLFKKNIILYKKILIIDDLIKNYIIYKKKYYNKSIFIFDKKKYYNNVLERIIPVINVRNIRIIDIIKYKILIFTRKSLEYFDKYYKKI
ncbi:uL4 family ribosomal protein [Candidatus Vidania fulgoroideorum]